MKRNTIEKPIFYATIIVTLLVIIPMIINPEGANNLMNSAFGKLMNNFGWTYLWFAVLALIVCMYIAFSNYGKIRLGEPDEKPQHSTFSWVAMLLCAGIGSSLMYWSSIEWAYYFMSPPYGAEPFSTVAADWATSYGLFHWGISAWAMYTLPTIPIAYVYWVRRNPSMKLSTACSGVIGEKRANGWFGKAIDIFFIFGLMGGCGTSIGLGTPMITAGLNSLFGIPKSFTVDLIIIICWCLVIGLSLYRGLEKGLKQLSTLNLKMAIFVLLFVLFVGPTFFILNTTSDALGHMFQNFAKMSFWTDSVGGSGFPQGWTVFYWAWWVVVAPFMGIWVAKISKGRTLKELILAEIIWGSLGCWMSYSILGNYALHLEINNIVPITEIIANQSTYDAIVAMLLHLPFGKVILFLFISTMFVFLSTTMDSAAFTTALVASKDLEFGEDPAKWYRVFWGFLLAALPISLLFTGGSLRALQTSSAVASPPILIIFIIMIVSFFKWVKEDNALEKYSGNVAKNITKKENIL